MKLLVLIGRGKPGDLRNQLHADYEFDVLEHPVDEQLIAGVSDVDATFTGDEPLARRSSKLPENCP